MHIILQLSNQKKQKKQKNKKIQNLALQNTNERIKRLIHWFVLFNVNFDHDKKKTIQFQS